MITMIARPNLVVCYHKIQPNWAGQSILKICLNIQALNFNSEQKKIWGCGFCTKNNVILIQVQNYTVAKQKITFDKRHLF